MTSAQRSLPTGFDIKRALINFVIAYLVVTVLATATSVTYGEIYQTPQPEALGVSLLQAPSFVATVPYHVLIMFLVWPVLACVYFRKRRPANQREELMETLRLSVFWLAAAMIVDLVCFVIVKHPYSLTPHEFYIEYQPWISLIYIAIFLSPLIRLGLSKFLRSKPHESDLQQLAL